MINSLEKINYRNNSITLKFGNNNYKKDKVIVIDDFDKINVDINGDLTPDLSHGEVVSRIITALHPETEIIKKQTSNNNQTIEQLTGIKNKLNKKNRTLDRTKTDGHDYSEIKAVCMPLAFPAEITTLQKIIDPAVNNKNLRKFADKIKEKMPVELEEPQTLTVIKLIEDIANGENSIPVFLPGGNNGRNHVNLLNFAKGARNIGVVNAKGIKVETFGINDLIAETDYEQGILNIQEVDGGYSLQGVGDDTKPLFFREETGGTGIPVTKKFIGKTIDSLTKGDDFNLNNPVIKEYSDYIKKLRTTITDSKERHISFDENTNLTSKIFSVDILNQISKLFEFKTTFLAKPSQFIDFYNNSIFEGDNEKIEEPFAQNSRHKFKEQINSFICYIKKLRKDGVNDKFEFEKDREFTSKLYSVKKLRQLTKQFKYENKYKDHIGEYITYDSNFNFRVDNNGIVYYDPSDSGRPGAIDCIQGSSFSTPIAVGKYLNQLRSCLVKIRKAGKA